MDSIGSPLVDSSISLANVLNRAMSNSMRQKDGRTKLDHCANTDEEAHSNFPRSRDTEMLFSVGVRTMWRSSKAAVKLATDVSLMRRYNGICRLTNDRSCHLLS